MKSGVSFFNFMLGMTRAMIQDMDNDRQRVHADLIAKDLIKEETENAEIVFDALCELLGFDPNITKEVKQEYFEGN